LNPHFLFNTLNGISTLVMESRKHEAAAMISRLSDFLRLTLEGTQTALVPLADELDYARRYLEIEEIRFGERLTVRYDVANDVLAVPVPTLLLQPLVENAIKHGIADVEQHGRIDIEARSSGETLLISVSDNGRGVDIGHDLNGNGIGLANTKSRLRELYGAGDWLKLENMPSGGTRVSIQIPLPVT
jgi:two-component system, LytTR family, sensor kinase